MEQQFLWNLQQDLGGLIRLKDLWVSPPLAPLVELALHTQRARCNGSNTAKATNGTDHGTQCASQVFGKNYGVTINCNKWVMNLYGGSDAGIAGPGFDVLKLFHLYKPNYSWVSETNGRQQNGDRNPTLSSHSWGYRSSSHSSEGDYYWYRPADIDGGTSATSYTTEPAFFVDVGNYGDSGRMKGEHPREASLCCCRKRSSRCRCYLRHCCR